MHGIIFAELEKFITTKLGSDGWASVVQDTGLPQKIYMPMTPHPDAEFDAIVRAAAAKMYVSDHRFQEEFGEAIVPGLLSTYNALVNASWRTLDLIENVGAIIHSIVKRADPTLNPPSIVAIRTSPTELILSYESPRKMCHFAKGIIRGFAHRHMENVQLIDEACMLQGEPKCTIRVIASPKRRSSSTMSAVKP